MIQQIKILAQKYYPRVLAVRQHIHSYPELSFEEHETMAFLCRQLDEIGVSYQSHVAGTGIVAIIKGKNPEKKCIALRADLDALPIQEANENAPYRSKKEGIMHACGHDVHAACLLGAAAILQEMASTLEGTVKLIFQPGEEKHPGGASLLIKEGVLDNPKPACITALHVYPHLPYGIVGFREGQYMASADEIYIDIEGKGGHAALPHQTVDPIAIAAQVIVSLQQVISRKGNPLIPSVLTFGKIQGGFVNNVIPDKVRLEGTFRTMDETWRYEAHQYIKDITHSICEAQHAQAKVEIPQGYPSLFNDPGLTAFTEKAAQAYLGTEKVVRLNQRMAGEDFSFYTHHVPGCFFRLGTNRNNETYTAPVHNPHFNIVEEAMELGMGLMAFIAVEQLQHFEE